LFKLETIDDVRNEVAVEDVRFRSHTGASIVVSNRDLRIIVKDPVKKLGGVSRVVPTDVSDFKMIEKSHYYKAIHKKASNIN
jgi:hypothetical protein